MAVNIPIKTTGGAQAVDELTRVGNAGAQALDRIRAGTQPASAGMKALGEISTGLSSQMGEMAGHAGIVGSALMAMGPMGLAAAAGIGTIGMAIEKVASEAESLHRFDNVFAAMLKSTDDASGKTVNSLDELAAAVSSTTMATREQVKQAETALLAFGNVGGTAFDRTIKDAQDLAVVMGTDLKSATVQIAKALEDPATGLSRLSRAGIVFTADQKEMIKGMVEAGDQAGALNAILGTLESKIGGAGSADASTVTGSMHKLTEAVNEMFESMGKSSSIGVGFEKMLDNLTGKIQGLTHDATDPGIQIVAKTKELLDLQAHLADIQKNGSGVLNFAVDTGRDIELTQQRITQTNAEIKAIQDRGRAVIDEAEKSKAAGIAHQTQTNMEAQDSQLMTRLNAADSEQLDGLIDKRNKDTAAAKQQADARAKGEQSIYNQIAALGNEYYALDLSDRERAIFNEELKAEATARSAGITLTQQQTDAIAAETGAIYDRNKAIANQSAADKQSAEALKKASVDRLHVMEEEVKKIDTTFHDGFVHALEKGKGAWSSFTTSLFNTFKSTVADQIYKLFLQPFVVEIAASIVGITGSQTVGAAAVNAVTGSSSTGSTLSTIGNLTSIGSAGSKIAGAYNTFSGGASLSENMNSGFATPMSSVFTLAYAAGAHMAGDWLASKFGATGTGGNIGGALGAAIGTFILPGLGTVVGSFLGSFIGSFIGNNQPSNFTAVAGANLSTGVTAALHGDSPNANTQAGANQLATDAVSISQLLTQITGATESIVNIQTQAGQRDRLAFGSTDNGMSAFDPKNPTYKAYATTDMTGAIAGLTSLLIDGLNGMTDAVKAQMKTAVSKIDFTNQTQATADLTFAFQYLNGTLLQAPKAVSNMQQSINQLNTAFANATAQATRLGLSTAQVAADQAAAMKALTDGFNSSIQDQILAITDPMAQALQAEATSAAARLQEAKDGGANLAAVEQLTALERDAIIKKYATSATNSLAGTAKSILDFVHQLTGTTSSPLATQTSLANAKAYYQDTLSKAQGGDATAQGAITTAAKDYLDLEQQMYASSSQYFTVFNGVTASLTMLANSLNVQGGVTTSSGYTAAQQSALDAINATVNYKPPTPNVPTPTIPDKATAQSVAATTATTDAVTALTVAVTDQHKTSVRQHATLIGVLTDRLKAVENTVAKQQSTLTTLANAPRKKAG